MACGLLAVGCAAAGKARTEVVAGLTDGTWNCVDDSGAPNLSFEAADGSFQLRNIEKGGKGETAPGSWKVIDKDIRASLGTEDGKEFYDVRGFDDLKAKAGTITVTRQRKGKTGQAYTFDIVVKRPRVVSIEAQDAKAWPSAPWTCTRR